MKQKKQKGFARQRMYKRSRKRIEKLIAEGKLVINDDELTPEQLKLLDEMLAKIDFSEFILKSGRR